MRKRNSFRNAVVGAGLLAAGFAGVAYAAKTGFDRVAQHVSVDEQVPSVFIKDGGANTASYDTGSQDALRKLVQRNSLSR